MPVVGMANLIKRAILLTSMLMLALPGWAQLQVGDNINMNLNGNLSLGYTDDFSNLVPSDHGITAGGDADFSGYYYNPGFVSFDVQPFYNQSRANSQFQSIFQSSGVGASASIFRGSNFPGTVSYSRTYNSEGGYSLPELGNLTTRGDGQNLGIGWGIRIPDYPNVSFRFMDGSTANSIFGTDAESTSHFETFGVDVTHKLAGFFLNGGYQYNTVHSLLPEFLSGEPAQTSDSSGGSYNFGVGHDLPLHGGFSAGFSRSDINSEYSGGSDNFAIDTFNAAANFQPIRNLSASVNTQYTDNLLGSLFQSIATAGGVVPAEFAQSTTHSLAVTGQTTYSLSALHLNLSAGADHQEQTVLGSSIASNAFHEMVNYGNTVLGGFLNATAGVTETTVDLPQAPSTLGWLETVTYTHRVLGWELSGSFNYSRDTATVLIAYTTTGYGYSAEIGRRIGRRSHWSFNAGGANSRFNNVAGSASTPGSFSQTYSTALALPRFSISGSYAKADGTSIITPTGLAPVPIPVPILTPAQAILFAGKTYSFGASTTPIRGLTLSATYASARSNTLGTLAASQNTTEQLSTQLNYKLRQLWITGGYLKLQQGFSIIGGPPTSGSSLYVGVSRWFKFF
jgi:hypothetical protein